MPSVFQKHLAGAIIAALIGAVITLIVTLVLIIPTDEYKPKYVSAYQELARMLVPAGHEVLGCMNLQSPQLQTINYSNATKAMQHFATVLNRMYDDCSSEQAATIEKTSSDPEFCYAMAKFLTYAAIVPDNDLGFANLDSDIRFWINKHADLVRKGSADEVWLRCNHFFRGFVHRYKAFEYRSNDKAEFSAELKAAEKSYLDALAASHDINDELWLPALLNLQDLLGLKYCLDPGQERLDSMRAFSDTLEEKVMPLSAIDPASTYDLKALAFRLNNAEVMLAMKQLGPAKQLIELLLSWFSENEPMIEELKTSHPAHTIRTMVRCQEKLCQLYELSDQMDKWPNGKAVSDLPVQLDGLRVIIYNEELSAIDYARDLFELLIMRLKLRYYMNRRVPAKKESYDLFGRINMSVDRSQDSWIESRTTSLAGLLLAQFCDEWAQSKESLRARLP